MNRTILPAIVAILIGGYVAVTSVQSSRLSGRVAALEEKVAAVSRNSELASASLNQRIAELERQVTEITGVLSQVARKQALDARSIRDLPSSR